MGPPDRDPGALIDEEHRSSYQRRGQRLRQCIIEALPGWIEAQIAQRLAAPIEDDPEIAAVSAAVTHSVASRLADLIEADVDDPRSGPLECIRQSLGPVTELLGRRGATQPERDSFDRRVRPDDVFALGPMSFLELGPDVHAAGIEWGAAKAFLHRRRNMPPPSRSS